jgi:penicillin-binding protein 2
VPWQLGETLIVGIGQGYMQTTPLQLAVMTARIANGGRAVQPRLVQQDPPADLTSDPGAAAGPAAPIGVSDWALRFVRQGMFEVVNGERGTARQAALADPETALAGKTGTSQVRRISRAERATGVRKNEDKPWEERDHALFVAFAPYHAPRYAFFLFFLSGGSGSQAASPIARDIVAKALELDPTRVRAPLTAGDEPAPAGDPA